MTVDKNGRNMTKEGAGGSFDTLSDYASTARGVVATGRDLDEANTKAKLITPLIRTLGWHVYDNEEVLLEYSGDEGFDDRVDYALFGPNGLHAVVEAKQIGRSLEGQGSQIRRYMRLFGADWGLLTNGEQYLLYQADEEADEELAESLGLADLRSSAHLQSLTRQSAYTTSAAVQSVDNDRSQLPEDLRREIETFVDREQGSEPFPPSDEGFGPLYDTLISAVAPTVQGHDAAKLAALLSLVGGVRKQAPDGQPIRGAIHLLIVHDPGTLAQELVKSVAQLAPDPVRQPAEDGAEGLLTAQPGSDVASRGSFPTRSLDTLSGASHVLLTRLDNVTEAELDDLHDGVRAEPPSGRQEAQMPGLVATSRPKYNRFDSYEPIGEQIGVEPELVSECDLLFVLTDQPGTEDSDAADHRLEVSETAKYASTDSDGSDWQERSETGQPSQTFVRTLITYARDNYYPQLDEDAQDHIRDF
jgi:hypothetical protein